MKQIISLAEVVDTRNTENGVQQVSALAKAGYDKTRHTLVIKLEADAELMAFQAPRVHLHVAWLPHAKTVEQAVALRDAVPIAKNVFHSWASVVRGSVPTQSRD